MLAIATDVRAKELGKLAARHDGLGDLVGLLLEPELLDLRLDLGRLVRARACPLARARRHVKPVSLERATDLFVVADRADPNPGEVMDLVDVVLQTRLGPRLDPI